MSLALRYAARSNTGLVREGNEDSVYAGPRLLAVADGMGGHAAGEVASAVVISAVARLDDDVPGSDLLASLRAAVLQANQDLADMVAGEADLRGMGTTLTALLASGSRLGLVHVGDSRAYLLRDGELRQITTDHTLVQALVDEGRITPEEADVHPQRSAITRTLDGSPVELDLSLREARAGDRYLLCSDGLSGVVSDATLAEALSAEEDPGRCADRLVELALRGGGPDNITCIVADVVAAAQSATTAPVVAGAAAPDGEHLGLPDTAAGRAAAVRRQSSPEPEAAPVATDVVPTPRRGRRVALAVVGLLALLAAAGFGYVRTQLFVGVAAGDVALYRGVSGSVVGVPLHSVKERTDIPVAELPSYEQSRVQQGISVSGGSEAQRVLATLRRTWRERCAAATPSPGPLPTNGPTAPPATGSAPSPAPTPAPTASPATACRA